MKCVIRRTRVDPYFALESPRPPSRMWKPCGGNGKLHVCKKIYETNDIAPSLLSYKDAPQYDFAD